ncbi:hypothetical protein NPA08_01715 [Mycoplasmopsis citelli]|uniref:trigger factor-related chaperone n=1 Tax=Mycoplasmopsis citelli TaxID=171281 RepID=UPI0021155691|nr:hypothetical protein [Mycoplasmopsis citelli]UUD36531.1 hypothetical protein NPA08_01715 [Mycoplasmopsis citelli]
MKFLTHPIKIDVVTWVNYQSDALKTLQKQAQEDSTIKITQEKILDYAYKMFILPELQKIWNSYLANSKNIIYFRPIEIISKRTPEKLEGEFKIYYFDELDNFNAHFQPQENFQIQENYEEQIQTFIEDFIKDYAFRINLSGEQTIQEGFLVTVKVSDKERQNARMHTIYASNHENKPLENLVMNKKVGEVFESDKLGQTLIFEIESAMLFKNQPITDENAKDILGKNFKNLQDVKDDIYKTTRTQIFNDALFKYGNSIVNQVIQSNKLIDIPEDLIQSDLAHLNFGPDYHGNPQDYVIATIYNFFWQMVFRMKLRIDISEEEFKKELSYAQNFLPIDAPGSIRPEIIVNSIILKKIALNYLFKYNPEIYEENKEYSHLKIQ